MTLAGFDHDPDGRPVVAWRDDCPGDVHAFWTRKDGPSWLAHEFVSERISPYAHQLILRPSDGAPFLLYAARVNPIGGVGPFRADLRTFGPSEPGPRTSNSWCRRRTAPA